MDFKIGFWNYVETGVLDPVLAVNDWQELGMTLPMSFTYNPKKHKKEDLLALLDECHKKDMKVIVCDVRTNFRNKNKVSEAEFEQGIQDAVADFGSHPAVFGFEIGDEPNKEQWEDGVKTYQMTAKYAPHLTPFINMYPNWYDEGFEKTLGIDKDGYAEKNADFMRRTGAKLISYDYYAQCSYFEKEKGFDLYFKNLNIFREASQTVGGKFFNSVLSVAHWSLREPTEDDIRWQISTSIAHGASGVMWFFVYERKLDGSFRYAPIDLFWKRTPMFDRLARQNRIVNEYYLKTLQGYEFDRVWHNLQAFGATPLFEGNTELKKIEYVVNPSPVAVSRFVNKAGKYAYVLVNLNQTEPIKIKPEFTEGLSAHNKALWFAPGQMMIFTETERI